MTRSIPLALVLFLVAIPVADADEPSPTLQSCLGSGDGELVLALSGAHDFDVEWANDGTSCTGVGTRFGVAVNFGRTIEAGVTLSVDFTIQQLEEGAVGEALPVAVRIGGNAVDDDLFQAPAQGCRVDVVSNEQVEETAANRIYRVVGEGSCDQPAVGMVSGQELAVGDFRFVGRTAWPR